MTDEQLTIEATLAEDTWADDGDDEEPVSQEEVARAVVTDTDWTAETILSQLRRGNIQLNPRFQRRDAWDRTRKSRFIESLILGLPIPQLVLAEDRRRRGAFIVLDGKQRLLSLRQFASGSSIGDADQDEFELLRLKGLDVRQDLMGITLAELEQDDDKADDLNGFLNQPIRTVVVRSWPSEEFLHLVFLRLNTGSVKLSPQELRQALHPGPFTDFIDDFSAESKHIQAALRIRKPDFRMRDVELLLRFFSFRQFLARYRGSLKDFLDNVAGVLNERWETEQQVIESLAHECELAIDATFAVFHDNAFFRWHRDGYERRFNRAVFDIMTYYLSLPAVRADVVARPEEVEAAFKGLCESNDDFVRSIQTTTKTIPNTALRLSEWGRVLDAIIDTSVPIPFHDEQDNRIVLPH